MGAAFTPLVFGMPLATAAFSMCWVFCNCFVFRLACSAASVLPPVPVDAMLMTLSGRLGMEDMVSVVADSVQERKGKEKCSCLEKKKKKKSRISA